MRNKLKEMITKIKCIQFGLVYKNNMWIHPSTEICVNRGEINVSEGVTFHKGTRIDVGWGGVLVFNRNVSLNTYTRIESGGCIVIGNNVLIGPNVYISDRNHSYYDISIPIRDQGYTVKGGIEIGDNTWIGIHACIIGNVKIGKGCVIGANAVVTNDVPDYCVAVGNPARIVRRYNPEMHKWQRMSSV
jgi:acetyltransferase-like isoleucine patch superfamily enzyme